jgi:hypothetical protein
VQDKSYKILLGGSSKHAVQTSSTFSAGFLKNVLLLPKDVGIEYKNVSAGQLHHLRTVQDTDGNFFVVNSVGDVLSKGYIGKDNLFYLLDKNLVQTPDDVVPSHRLKIELVPGRRLKNAATYVPKRRRVIRHVRSISLLVEEMGLTLRG